MIQYKDNQIEVISNLNPWKVFGALLDWPTSNIENVFGLLKVFFSIPISASCGKDSKFGNKLMKKSRNSLIFVKAAQNRLLPLLNCLEFYPNINGCINFYINTLI